MWRVNSGENGSHHYHCHACFLKQHLYRKTILYRPTCRHHRMSLSLLNWYTTVSSRYNVHVRFQSFCCYNKSAVVTICLFYGDDLFPFKTNGKWNDINCDSKNTFVCELAWCGTLSLKAWHTCAEINKYLKDILSCVCRCLQFGYH
jgi:hypothetical protein